MTTFREMSRVQQLLVVDPDFRAFMGRRFPWYTIRLNLITLAETQDASEIDWLSSQVHEYLTDEGLTALVCGDISFALDTLVAFHIGRLNAWSDALYLHSEAEGTCLDTKRGDEILSLLRCWGEIQEWARDVYGMKIPSVTSK